MGVPIYPFPLQFMVGWWVDERFKIGTEGDDKNFEIQSIIISRLYQKSLFHIHTGCLCKVDTNVERWCCASFLFSKFILNRTNATDCLLAGERSACRLTGSVSRYKRWCFMLWCHVMIFGHQSYRPIALRGFLQSMFLPILLFSCWHEFLNFRRET